MKSTRFILILFLFFVGICRSDAQVRNDTTRSVTAFMFNIHAVAPALNFQFGFSDKYSIVAQMGMVAGFQPVLINGNRPDINVTLFPKAIGQFRIYYNFNKRVRKGKVTSRNSANFVALHFQYNFRPVLSRFDVGIPGRFAAGPVWGMQRTSRLGVNFNFYVGPAVSVTEKVTYTTLLGNTRYGNRVFFTPIVGVSIGGTVFSTAGKSKKHRVIDFAG